MSDQGRSVCTSSYSRTLNSWRLPVTEPSQKPEGKVNPPVQCTQVTYCHTEWAEDGDIEYIQLVDDTQAEEEW